jgi:Ca2+-binding EF-hand superfamily protein
MVIITVAAVEYRNGQPDKSSLEGKAMISRRTVLHTLAAATLIGGSIPAFARSRQTDALKMLDTDNDGTVDLDEAKKAASALFDKLDRDHDGTLDKRELAGRLSAKEFTAADSDHDGTLSKDEYLVVVEQRFKAANSDNDGTLDAKELSSRAGRNLLRLLR